MEQGAIKVGESRVKTLQSEVNGVKEIMTKNVERILERGERLDDLMGKTEDLQADEKEAIKASETRVTTLQRELGGVVDIMTKNMERIVERIRDRGERLDDLMGKTEDLQADVQYTPRNVTGSYSYWWKNVKMIICIVVVVVIIILIIILLATGVIPTSSSKPSP
ncbi:vesicle-associated membrane protein 8-like isoform X2 [Lepisosteus oculatus]|uniref:vesicle-associated membrane protein 8-like isoform X2 n=1 Tax=Lepisosteus oculatus TaxID=7918 RepID=UPI0035F50A14